MGNSGQVGGGNSDGGDGGDGGDGDPAQLQGTVVFTEPLGAHTIVHVRLESGDTITALETADAPMPGDAVRIDFAAADVHLFDRHGKRVDAESSTAA